MTVSDMRAKAVFLDKDGTLIEDVPYNVDPELIRFNRHVLDGLQMLHRSGFKLIIVTNQSGVALGRFAEDQIEGVKSFLEASFAAAGVPLSGFYYCPHHPEGVVPDYSHRCKCRKPQSGMLRRATEELYIDQFRSWMIGDILDDVEAGRRWGCRTVLLDHGGETKWELTATRRPHFKTRDFLSAAEIVISESSAHEMWRDVE